MKIGICLLSVGRRCRRTACRYLSGYRGQRLIAHPLPSGHDFRGPKTPKTAELTQRPQAGQCPCLSAFAAAPRPPVSGHCAGWFRPFPCHNEVLLASARLWRLKRKFARNLRTGTRRWRRRTPPKVPKCGFGGRLAPASPATHPAPNISTAAYLTLPCRHVSVPTCSERTAPSKRCGCIKNRHGTASHGRRRAIWAGRHAREG